MVFYLTSGNNLVAVKLNYSSSVDINDYAQPATLAAAVAAAVNADPLLEGYSVVGYAIKAGLGIHTFGTTFTDLIQNTGGNAALASGTYDGSVNISPTEIASLDPIELAPPAAALSMSDVLDTTVIDDGNRQAKDDKPGERGHRASGKDDATGADPDVLPDDSGDSLLGGSEGADVFKWTLAEPGAHDTISNFDMNEPASGGDVLDLRDLLPPESAASLDSYLHFEDSGTGGTLVKISPAGDFTGDAAHDANVAYQTIELQNVDLLSIGNDQQIIDMLINHGKLITE